MLKFRRCARLSLPCALSCCVLTEIYAVNFEFETSTVASQNNIILSKNYNALCNREFCNRSCDDLSAKLKASTSVLPIFHPLHIHTYSYIVEIIHSTYLTMFLNFRQRRNKKCVLLNMKSGYLPSQLNFNPTNKQTKALSKLFSLG